MHARKKAGQISTPLYGIATDSWFWTFIRLDTQGKVSTHTLHWWEGREVEIISYLSRIMQRAACSSSAQGCASSREPSPPWRKRADSESPRGGDY
ncbi:hypothetical protein BJX65DRAFT_313913 [Aspergillus insuetus]